MLSENSDCAEDRVCRVTKVICIIMWAFLRNHMILVSLCQYKCVGSGLSCATRGLREAIIFLSPFEEIDETSFWFYCDGRYVLSLRVNRVQRIT